MDMFNQFENHQWRPQMNQDTLRYHWNYQSDNWYENRVPYYGKNALKDFGPNPFVINIEEAAEKNKNFRTTLWTGRHLQITLMSINVGEDIGLEIHPYLDQFLRIEEGHGLMQMGKHRDQLDFHARVKEDYAIMIPAGTWHNLINLGNKPIKLYSIYAPPQHPHGTVHQTKANAMAAEANHRYL